MMTLLEAAESVNAESLFRAVAVDAATKLAAAFDAGQQDAAELLNVLLDYLSQDADLSTLANLFAHRHQRTITHNWCGYTSVRQQTGVRIVDLAVPRDDNQTTITALINNFFAPEKLRRNCTDGCHAKGIVMDSFTEVPSSPPACLALSLKRWDNHGNKIHTPILVERVTSFGGANYSLCAVSLHTGERARAGHYVTIARNPEDGCFWLFDDCDRPQRIANISAELERGETAIQVYLAFYSRQDAPLW
jgi:uncharacterized UBP type Zn finger protein